MYITYDGKWEFVCFEKIDLILRECRLIYEIIPCGYENSEMFRFVSSFESVNHLVSFVIIETTSYAEACICRYYINSCYHRSQIL